MTPEAKARLAIDERLQQAGWLLQDYKQLNLGAGPGMARIRAERERSATPRQANRLKAQA